jgi:AAA domain
MSRRVLLIPASQVQRERVEWVWPERIPLGAVSLLVGDPGLGKSMLHCSVAARLSQEGKRTIMTTAEDSLAAVVRPRLEAAGADLEQITFVRVSDEGGEDGLLLPDDVQDLEVAVEEEQAVFVAIDPLTAHLPGSVNSWRDQSIRLALAPLHLMAERRRCAVQAILHLNKGLSSDPLRRIGGSIGLPAAARSVLLLARDPDDEEGDEGTRRVLAHVKTNYGRLAQSLAFDIEPRLLPALNGNPEVETARLVELGESEHRAEALLGRADPEERTAIDEAVMFLEQELGDRTMDAATVQKNARSLGISPRTLDRAKARAGVAAERVGGIGEDGRWTWRLRTPKGLAPLANEEVGALSANPHETTVSDDPAPLRTPNHLYGALSGETEKTGVDDRSSLPPPEERDRCEACRSEPAVRDRLCGPCWLRHWKQNREAYETAEER